MGSRSKDLLSAVLRAEADMNHYPAAVATPDDEAEMPDDPELVASSSTPTFGNNLKPVPAPLIIDYNMYEDEDDYEHGLQLQNRERIQHRREDSGDMGQELQSRGRYVSMTSMRSQQTRPSGSPSTPTRSASSQRRNGLNIGFASPLARSYAGRGRPLSSVEGSTITEDRRYRHDTQGHASNDDVLAALKRLESRLAFVAINTNKHGVADGGKSTGKEGDNIAPCSTSKTGDHATTLKELGERQTRIEALLLSLTRGMRS